ncbi:hypothetical protein B5F55_07455 [Anaerotruncus colihominis]|nr:hypothetical protein B5F55_07455 [Anaerotruncus colihominis]
MHIEGRVKACFSGTRACAGRNVSRCCRNEPPGFFLAKNRAYMQNIIGKKYVSMMKTYRNLQKLLTLPRHQHKL